MPVAIAVSVLLLAAAVQGRSILGALAAAAALAGSIWSAALGGVLAVVAAGLLVVGALVWRVLEDGGDP